MRTRQVFSEPRRYYKHVVDTWVEIDRQEYDRLSPGKFDPSAAPAMYMGRNTEDWSSENNGKGREMTQLRDAPYKPKVYAKNPQDAYEKGKRAGKTVERITD